MCHVTEYAPPKTGEFLSDFSQLLCCDKYLKDYKLNSLYLTLYHVQIFVLEHYMYLFFEAHSFP